MHQTVDEVKMRTSTNRCSCNDCKVEVGGVPPVGLVAQQTSKMSLKSLFYESSTHLDQRLQRQISIPAAIRDANVVYFASCMNWVLDGYFGVILYLCIFSFIGEK